MKKKILMLMSVLCLTICGVAFAYGNHAAEPCCHDHSHSAVCEQNKKREPCRYCNGQGSNECTMCEGTGWRTCSMCGGSGEIVFRDGHTEKCENCAGKGKFKCGYCNTTGRRKCTACNGTGVTRYLGE